MSPSAPLSLRRAQALRRTDTSSDRRSIETVSTTSGAVGASVETSGDPAPRHQQDQCRGRARSTPMSRSIGRIIAGVDPRAVSWRGSTLHPGNVILVDEVRSDGGHFHVRGPMRNQRIERKLWAGCQGRCGSVCSTSGASTVTLGVFNGSKSRAPADHRTAWHRDERRIPAPVRDRVRVGGCDKSTPQLTWSDASARRRSPRAVIPIVERGRRWHRRDRKTLHDELTKG